MAVDEVKLINDNCPATKYCDFEAGICNYEHDVTADFQWARQRGATISSGTGPAVDKTYQTTEGFYMYIEASYPQLKGL